MRVRSLLQVHYHDRRGGVTTVMAAYAAAFRRIAGEHAAQRVICCSYQTGVIEESGATVESVRDCDYRLFVSRRAFDSMRRRLCRMLRATLESSSLVRPVAVVAHNLNLGKNCALSAAFADVARYYGGTGDDIRFFSVVHDRAEEGRIDLLRGIERVAGMGIPVWPLLYPSLPNLRYVTPSKQVAAALGAVGFAVEELFDPVLPPRKLSVAGGVIGEVTVEAFERHGTVPPRPGRPLVFYPARVIARKNPIEAVVAAGVVQGCNLLIGSRGTAPADRRLCDEVERACGELGIPVLFDAGGAVASVSRRRGVGPVAFESLYHAADLCISTAVLEGFGYALYEPWVRGAGLLGRRPRGFAPYGGLRCPWLYDSMTVPLSWIDRRAFRRRLMRVASATGAPSGACVAIERDIERLNRIDFALLGTDNQLAVLRALAEDRRLAEYVVCHGPGFDEPVAHAFGTARTVLVGGEIAANGARIERSLGPHRFDRAFARCLLATHRRAAARGVERASLISPDLAGALLLMP